MQWLHALGGFAIDGFLTLVVPIFGTAIAGMITEALLRWLQVINVTLSQEQEEALRALVRKILSGVEELARTKSVTGTTKLAKATDLVVEQTGLSRERAAELIHQELPTVRRQIGGINSGLPGGGLR